MIFNSLTYLIFLLFVVIMYWILSYRLRLFLIFIASLLFYGFWRIEFIPVMMISVIVDYFVAKRMPSVTKPKRKQLLLISLFVNLGLLFYFKYLIFFVDNAIGFAHLLGVEIDPVVINIILPLGISFYTFQTISYTVDVYRGFIEPENDFVLYACYVTFFPQLVAGPILRAAEVIPQFANRIAFSWDDVAKGSWRIIYGLFLKVVLADNIAPLVDSGFAMGLNDLSALDVWTLAFLFGFQIYFDFSAYSHIAIGSARLMGIHFPENFYFPYLATSPKDFWRRWHISLSSWIRDYLYLPLTGAKVYDRSIGGLGNATSEKKHTSALFLSWGIMGLWHGANWTFLLWGIYHAITIFIYRLMVPFTRHINKRVKLLGGLAVTLPVMMLGWIPFRTETAKNALFMWSKLFNFSAYTWLGMRENTYLITALILLGIFTVFLVGEKLSSFLRNQCFIILFGRVVSGVVMVVLVFVFLRPINQFIYFQF